MADYIRTTLDFYTDPRNGRLNRQLGTPLGAQYFQRLQIFAFRMAPTDGDLRAFTAKEIAKAVGFPSKKDPRTLLEAFVDSTWCDWSPAADGSRSIRVRSWEVLQPYAVGVEARSQNSRAAANAMHLKRSGQQGAGTGASNVVTGSTNKSSKSPKSGSAAPSAEWPDEEAANG